MDKETALEICMGNEALTPEELDLLCEITQTKNIEAASEILRDPSVINRWRERGKIPILTSVLLKEFFLEKLSAS